MSGRDLRNFVTAHRVDDAERMVRRAKEGVVCTNIKPFNYDQIRAMIAEKKFSGQEALLKVKQLETASRQRKDESLAKQHRLVWSHELGRLAALRRQLQLDIDAALLGHMSADSEVGMQQIYDNFSSYREALTSDFAEFKMNTTDAVWALRKDLQLWMEMYRKNPVNASVEIEEPETVMETIASIRSQQESVIEALCTEQHQLESELNIGGLIDPASHVGHKYVQTGIPEEAFDLECPDMELKVSVLQEFILLDGKYVEKLNELEQQHSEVLRSATGGWSAEDHNIFLYAMEAYTRDFPNRRTLYIDYLRRCLTHKTRADIVLHEEWWISWKFYHQRRQDLTIDWTRDRLELLNHVKNTFHEAIVSHQLENSKLENRQKQREFCDALFAKVSEWRERKMEIFRLQQELAEAERQNAEELRAAEEEKEREKREKQKMKIHQFQAARKSKRQQEEDRDKCRLEELKEFFKEQAAYDQARVKFREEELVKKQETKQKKIEEQRQAAEEKAQVLEAIRAKVRPHVEGDLLRLWSDTVAWQARQKPDEYLCIQQPLYDIKSFTANQIMADPRVRVEQRIREAGLQTNEYARQVLRQMQPAHQPRRDMESTLFK